MRSEVFDTALAVDLGKAAMDFAAEVAGSTERKKKSLPAPAGLQTFFLYIRAQGHVPEHTVSGITAAEHNYDLDEGEMVALAAAIPHEVLATRATVLLVTHALRD